MLVCFAGRQSFFQADEQGNDHDKPYNWFSQDNAQIADLLCQSKGNHHFAHTFNAAGNDRCNLITQTLQCLPTDDNQRQCKVKQGVNAQVPGGSINDGLGLCGGDKLYQPR